MGPGTLTGNRETFFAAIRKNIEASSTKAKAVENPMDGLFTQRETTHERNTLLTIFLQEWTALGGYGYSIKNRKELAQKMAEILAERKIKLGMRWNHPELDKLGLEEIFTQAQASLSKWPPALNDDDWIGKAAAMELGIVWGDLAMAETGTIVLPATPATPTAVCILPLTLIVIFTAAQLIDGFYSVIKLLKQRYRTDLPTTITFLTGPSRTSDIEMDLTIGVHGSKYVYALVLEGQE